MTDDKRGIAILGVFVADLAFRADRMPAMGETIFGSGFKMGPGGKGSNQSVAAARLGADVTFISRLGADDFGAVALATWRKEGIAARVIETPDQPTGAAFIYVNDKTGENAIIVATGVAANITPGRRRRGGRRDPQCRGLRHPARAAGGSPPIAASRSPGRRSRHRVQPGAGRAGR